MLYFLVFVPVVLAVVYSAYIIWWLSRQPSGNSKMMEISSAILDGSTAYLNRQYRSVAVVAVILAFLIYSFIGGSALVGFLVGALASALAGYIGMNVAV